MDLLSTVFEQHESWFHVAYLDIQRTQALVSLLLSHGTSRLPQGRRSSLCMLGRDTAGRLPTFLRGFFAGVLQGVFVQQAALRSRPYNALGNGKLPALAMTPKRVAAVLDLVDAFSQHEPDMDDASNLDALKHSMNTSEGDARQCILQCMAHGDEEVNNRTVEVVRLFDVETLWLLQEVARWVHHFGLREQFAALSGAAQKQVVDSIRLFPTLKKVAMQNAFRKAAVDHQQVFHHPSVLLLWPPNQRRP
ncbi:unnamed protein product [Symbiodinium microadriaticum]|nr:unnamed protein product [Symbiodinium sp. KB8]CAE7209436.1 unnamed protein product [Symbiodinium microadriaticum]